MYKSLHKYQVYKLKSSPDYKTCQSNNHSNWIYIKNHIGKSQDECPYMYYSETRFERPPWREAKPSGKALQQCKSKHKFIYFYHWWQDTPLKGHFSGAKGVASQEGFHCLSRKQIPTMPWFIIHYQIYLSSSLSCDQFSCDLFSFTFKCLEGKKVIFNIYF